MELVVHSDGGSRGNPGPAAIGVVVEARRDGGLEVVAEVAERIGVTTNNVAEYRALIRGLEEAQRLGAVAVSCLLDSQLVVEQMNGRYKVKHENVLELHRRATEVARSLKQVTFSYVPRAQNAEADRLVNAALDGRPVARTPAAPEQLELTAPAFTSQSRLEPLAGSAGVRARVLIEADALAAMEIHLAPGSTLDRGRMPVAQHLACLAGEGWLTVGGDEQAFADGQFTLVPPGVLHAVRAGPQGMALLVAQVRR